MILKTFKKIILLTLLTLAITSCGNRGESFKIEGRLLNMNQAEFFVYSPDGIIEGVDTIKVEGGRFLYQTHCAQEGALIIIFPNFSEQAIFAQPGKQVSISGDAYRLKDISIKGTKENELMSSLRKKLSKASPKEEVETSEKFILDNPKSIVSPYVLKKYILNGETFNLDRAIKLAKTLKENQPENSELDKIIRYCQIEKKRAKGATLPSFKTKDIFGKTIDKSSLNGKVVVVYTWSSWNIESKVIRDKLNKMKDDYGNRLTLLGINLDASLKECKRNLSNDSTSSIIICDGMFFQSPLLEKFSLTDIPDNIIYENSKVIDKGLSQREIQDKIKSLLD